MDFTLYIKRVSRILDWLFPSTCPKCETHLSFGEDCPSDCGYVDPAPINPCRRCSLEIPFGTERCGECLSTYRHFDKCIAAFRYHGPIRDLVLDLKNSGNRGTLRKLSAALVDQILRNGKTIPEVIIPVPMHRESLKSRGFNQSTMLATAVGKQLKIPVDRKLLVKQRKTPKQAELRLRERKKNLRSAFKLNKSNSYKNVAIIDDVVTSTSTISEICKILKKNGVDYIEVWSIARAS